MHTDKVVGIIPARYASTRFPGKLLKKIEDKTIIRRVWEQCLKSQSISDVVVATDNDLIKDEVQSFGGRVLMTASSHQSGTDRVAEAAEKMDADIIVNIQGDEPFIDPTIIDAAVQPLLSDPSVLMSTVASKISLEEELSNPNIVKVIINKLGYAIYFSRYPIPYLRDELPFRGGGTSVSWYKHIGLYSYRKDYLRIFCNLPPSTLEISEKLEQLRAIENGHSIKVSKVQYDAFGIDTPEDLERASTAG